MFQRLLCVRPIYDHSAEMKLWILIYIVVLVNLFVYCDASRHTFGGSHDYGMFHCTGYIKPFPLLVLCRKATNVEGNK